MRYVDLRRAAYFSLSIETPAYPREYGSCYAIGRKTDALPEGTHSVFEVHCCSYVNYFLKRYSFPYFLSERAIKKDVLCCFFFFASYTHRLCLNTSALQVLSRQGSLDDGPGEHFHLRGAVAGPDVFHPAVAGPESQI